MHVEFTLTRKHLTRALSVVLASVLAVAALAACTSEPSSQEQEQNRQQSSYDKLTTQQPAKQMTYSPTRDTINFWIEKWSKPGKLSYVYLQNADGQLLGYYVLKGLPVSYCAMLTPNYQLRDASGDGDGIADFKVPAPGMDGAYYSGSGSCDTYYGRDATTNAYIEYTAGLGINVLLYDQPLPANPNVKPLGRSEITKDGKVVKR